MKIPHTKYNRYVWLPMGLIKDAIDNNYLDSLCYFAWMKIAFDHKPIFYNYNLRKVGNKIGCSPTTAGYHINILLSKGILHERNGHLCLMGRSKLKTNFKSFLVPVGIDRNKSNQIAYLRFATIKTNLHSQSRKHSEKSAILKFRKGLFHDYDEVKRLRRIDKKYPATKIVESSIQNVLTLSNRKFGDLCNRSQSTGIKIQKKLNELFLLKSIKRVKRVKDIKMNRKGFFSLELPSDHFLSNSNYCMKRLSNELVCIGIEM